MQNDLGNQPEIIAEIQKHRKKRIPFGNLSLFEHDLYHVCLNVLHA